MGRSRRRPTARFATLLTAALAGAFALLPAAPAQAASSWRTVRTEEFSGSSLPSGCDKYTGKYTGGASVWKKDDVQLKGGLLRLRLQERKASGRSYTSGGVGCWGWAQKYGRYEVRAKVPQGKGIDSYLTLVPTKAGDGAWSGIELLAPDGGPETAFVTNGHGKASETAQVQGDYSDKFHTYVIEWAPKHLRITVDGDQIFYSTKSYSKKRWFGLVVSNGDALTGVPDPTTDLPASFQIDRVKVSAYTGVPPKKGTVTAVATPVPSGLPTRAPVPATTAPVSDLQAVDRSGQTLTGGVWPWLLGGSVIAGAAALLLGYPVRRDAQRRSPQTPWSTGPRTAGPGSAGPRTGNVPRHPSNTAPSAPTRPQGRGRP